MRKGVIIAAAFVITGAAFFLLRSPEPHLEFVFVGYLNGDARLYVTNDTSSHLFFDEPCIQIKTASGWTNYVDVTTVRRIGHRDAVDPDDIMSDLEPDDDLEFSAKLPEGHFVWRAQTRFARFPSPLKVRVNQWVEQIGFKPLLKPTWYSTTTPEYTR